MSRAVWAFGWIGVAIWSLTCALAYGLFDLVGRGLMRSSDSWSSSPEAVENLFKFFSFLHSFSTGAVVLMWAIVSLLILAVPWVFDRVIGKARVSTIVVQRPGPGGDRRFDGRDGVIDLPPDQYSVGPRPGPQPGPAPRIPPRA